MQVIFKMSFRTIGFLLAFFSTGCLAQTISPSAINTIGGSFTSGTNIYDLSLGEMVLTRTAVQSNFIITEGLLQPIQHTTTINNHKISKGLIRVYPNPCSNILYVEFNLPTDGIVSYSMKDMMGKQIIANSIKINKSKKIIEIDSKNLPAATYVLNIINKTNEANQTASFKIIKIE
jgi:hypothetical protein